MSRTLHTGSCQCGAIAFQVTLDLDRTIRCNCSRCRRLGAVLAFTERAEFELTADGPSTTYRFHRGHIAHRFCPVCGIQTHAESVHDGVAMVAVNVNCLDGVDTRTLRPEDVNGADF